MAAGTAMAEVMETIRTVSQLMAQIDSSANEQAGDIAGFPRRAHRDRVGHPAEHGPWCSRTRLGGQRPQGPADTLTSSIGQYRLA